MALADKQSDSEKHKITNATELAAISSSFAAGKHIDLKDFPGEAAILYQIQKIEEDIDELRRYLNNEGSGSAISLTSLTGIKLPASAGTGQLYKDKNGFVKIG